MRFLFLTPQLPYPPNQGAAIRNYSLISSLAPRHEIHLLSFAHSPPDAGEAGPLLRLLRQVRVVPFPSRPFLKRALSTLLSPRPDLALRLQSREFQAVVKEKLAEERFDAVQVEALEMAPYVEHLVGRKVRPLLVYDAHNAEHLLQKRAFQVDVRDPRRWLGAFYSLLQWRKLRRYEGWVISHFDRLIVTSPQDGKALEALAAGKRAWVIPNAVDTDLYRPVEGVEEEELVFTGKMDFRPNVDAMLWFCREVWPLLKSQIPGLRFCVVGQSPSPAVLSLADDPSVTVTGPVEDDREHMARARVYVAPLRVGGGTRLKILRAMAMGKAIVATSMACEGIELRGDELLLADTPQAFAQAILALWDDAGRRRELGHRARALVEARYDWRGLLPQLETVYAPR